MPIVPKIKRELQQWVALATCTAVFLLSWETDIYEKRILVGDKLAISPNQALEHKLTKIIEIKDKTSETLLVGYQTNPLEKCSGAINLPRSNNQL